MTNSNQSNSAIRAVAFYEVIKGIGGLGAAFALWRWHTHLLDWLSAVEALWLARFSSLFNAQIDALMRFAERASGQWQWFLLLLISYAIIRFIEAYGLWQDKAWAYWLSVLGYGLFIPLEIYYLLTLPFDWLKFAILLVNVCVVVVVYRQMHQKGLL